MSDVGLPGESFEEYLIRVGWYEKVNTYLINNPLPQAIEKRFYDCIGRKPTEDELKIYIELIVMPKRDNKREVEIWEKKYIELKEMIKNDWKEIKRD